MKKINSLKPLSVVLVFASLSFPFLSPLAAEQTWNRPPERLTLSNGIPLLFHFDDTSSVTVIQIMILGGRSAEPEGKEGVSYLTTRLMLEIPDDLKLRQLMGQSTRISMVSENDYSLISIACLSENVEDALDVITGIMLKPLFSGIRISTLKGMMNDMRERDEDDPGSTANIAHRNIHFHGTAYSGSVYGSEASLKSIKKKDIDSFYDTYFRTRNIVVSAVSDLEQSRISGLLEQYLAEVPEGSVELPTPADIIPQEGNKSEEIERDVQQNLVSFAFPLGRAVQPDLAKLELLETLLGKGIGSRLWPLRAEENLAYSVAASATQMRGAGLLEVFLETDESKLERAEQSITGVLKKLREEGITAEELAVTKTYAKASFLRANESKFARARTFAHYTALGMDFDFLKNYLETLEAVTLEDINAFITRVLDPGCRSRIIIGPKKTGSSNSLFSP